LKGYFCPTIKESSQWKATRVYIMMTIHKRIDGELRQINAVEPGCWINIYPPFTHEQLLEISAELEIDIDYLTDSLDVDERSRYDTDDDVEIIVINVPLKREVEDPNDLQYINIPVGIISKPDFIVTISAFENPVINMFLKGAVKNFDPSDQSMMALHIFDKTVYFFLRYLKEINNVINVLEKELYDSSRNEELAKMLLVQKSLVYFVTNLRSNEFMMMKIQRTDFLKIKEDEFKSDHLSDIIVDNNQALEMSNVYTNILNGTMDAFASIISNNLNQVMKRLTSVTIILTLPTLVSGLYGMNVVNGWEQNPHAFLYLIVISLVITGVTSFYFWKRRWF